MIKLIVFILKKCSVTLYFYIRHRKSEKKLKTIELIERQSYRIYSLYVKTDDLPTTYIFYIYINYVEFYIYKLFT